MGKYFSKEKWKYVLYTVSHPMDGYYWIRHRDKGSVPIAIILMMLFSFSFTANRLFASFVVNDMDPRGIDTIYELTGAMIFFFLICVGNWSITCLMDGEGRMKDIVIAVGYGTVPITTVLILGALFSQVVADDEVVFYAIFLAAGIGYGLIMMLMGVMQVHNYTLGKTLITLLLTFVAMLIIIFVILLLGEMLSRVWIFFRSIYTEIIFRT